MLKQSHATPAVLCLDSRATESTSITKGLWLYACSVGVLCFCSRQLECFFMKRLQTFIGHGWVIRLTANYMTPRQGNKTKQNHQANKPEYKVRKVEDLKERGKSVGKRRVFLALWSHNCRYIGD